MSVCWQVVINYSVTSLTPRSKDQYWMNWCWWNCLLVGGSVLHRAGPPASGWQLSARTCNFVTSRPYWPATFCLVAMSTTMSICTRVVTCHRLDGSIVFLVDAQNLPSTNLSGSLKGVIFPRPVVRPTPGYRFYIQSICVSMACNEQAILCRLPSLWTKCKTTLFIQCNKLLKWQFWTVS